MANPRVSNTGVGIVSPITAYEGEKEAAATADQFVQVFPARVVGVISPASTSLQTDDYDSEDLYESDDDSGNNEDGSTDKGARKAPQLSDIELISNDLVYDAANNPSATVVFKVKNSSGEVIKSINARVQVR